MEQSLIMYRPLVSNRITQRFGENKACIFPNGRITSKINNVCPNGATEFYTSIGMLGHSGIDFAAVHGEQIFHAATYDGWMKVEKDFSGGIGVDVISNEPVKLGNGRSEYVKLRYWHLKTPVGYDGKQVKFGQVIGLADNTGASSGDHLHFGLKVCDKDGNALEAGNGYNGAIDPMPYLNNIEDARQSADFLLKAPPLSEEDKKEINSQLSIARQLLLALKAYIERL